MSKDKKQDNEDKHKKLKQYAKENAEIAGIAGAGVLAGRKAILDPVKSYVSRGMAEGTFQRSPQDIKKIYDAYKADKLDDGIHILTDPENGKKVLSFHTDIKDKNYYSHEVSRNPMMTNYKNLTPKQLADAHFEIAHKSVYRDDLPLIEKQREALAHKLGNPDIQRKLKKLYADKDFSGSIHHTGEAGTMLHEMTHASRSGLHSKFLSNIHLPSTPSVLGKVPAVLPTTALLASGRKRKDESERDYQKRVGRNIGLATLGATAISAPGQVVEEARANIGAVRRAKALGININTRPLKSSYLGYWAGTAGKPIATGLGTYAAMKLWRRNKLKEEQNKAKLEKKSSLSDEEIMAGIDTAKREAHHGLIAASLAAGASFPLLHLSGKRHGISASELPHHTANKTPQFKKMMRDYGIAASGVAALPYLFRKKGTIEYYKDELERAKKNKH